MHDLTVRLGLASDEELLALADRVTQNPYAYGAALPRGVDRAALMTAAAEVRAKVKAAK